MTEIDTALQEIEKSLQTKENEKIEEVKKSNLSLESLTEQILERTDKVDRNTDTLFEHYLSEILKSKDHSESTKNLLIESQRLKNEGNANLVEIIKAVAKIKAAEMSPKNGIFIQTKSADDVGINLNNFQES
ncbi:MAG: hypothetical protein LBF97_05935 [Elusimicrobiota bacterium]|jgi:hypothetical protein|nr:hypothetical protein [Elusimicrobiota bacterium]